MQIPSREDEYQMPPHAATSTLQLRSPESGLRPDGSSGQVLVPPLSHLPHITPHAPLYKRLSALSHSTATDASI